MKKELIKQIKELPGVKTVESMSDKVVVTFEATKHEAIKIQTKEQSNFIIERSSDNRPEVFERCPNDIYIEINSMNGWWQFSEKYSHKYNIISFTQYLTDYNLQDEWEKYLIGEAEKRGFKKGVKFKSPVCGSTYRVSKVRINSILDNCLSNSTIGCIYDGDTNEWAEIIPDELELVKGEIYYKNYSIIRHGIDWIDLDDKHFYGSQYGFIDKPNGAVEATDKQKRKLIKAEVKNGYFHELNKAK